MGYAIDPQGTEFLMGISNITQLQEWLEKNQDAIGIVVVGRSNVGKSSLINALFGKSTARVSKTPGRTREINIFNFELLKDNKKTDMQKFFLIDLPGYGHAEVSKEMSKAWDQLIGCFFFYLPQQMLIMNIQDARHPDQKSDREFYKFLKNFENRAILIYNKMDKLKTQKERAELNKMIPQLSKLYKWIKQFYFVSAETKQGVPPLAEAIVAHALLQVEVNQSLS